ncbi:MAG: hypothetical protein QXY76_07035 [Nitrososphaeria archaeon]
MVAGIVAGSIASYPLLIEPNIIVKSEVHIKIEGIEKKYYQHSSHNRPALKKLRFKRKRGYKTN